MLTIIFVNDAPFALKDPMLRKFSIFEEDVFQGNDFDEWVKFKMNQQQSEDSKIKDHTKEVSK